MIAAAVQLHCPFCHAAQSAVPGVTSICEYCLQPFGTGDVESGEARLLVEIQRWLGQRLEAPLTSPAGVDAQSRAYLFAHKILPELVRDIDRATEGLAGHAQMPLVTPPLSIGYAGLQNPLRSRRTDVLKCTSLRARLTSADVLAFATLTADRDALGHLEGRLNALFYLSNAAFAGGRGDAAGYAAAHKNLGALQDELRAHPSGDAIFQEALRSRYQALGELCQICETLYDGHTGDRSAQTEQVAQRLERAAREIEASAISPADAMPLAIGAKEEAAACHALARWLAAHHSLAKGAPLSFLDFVRGVEPFLGGAPLSGPDAVERVEIVATVVSAARGRTQVHVLDDFSWVPAFVDGVRGRKTLGLFGHEEEVQHVEELLLPVWLADVAYSRRAGGVFREGVEGRGVALTYAPRADQVAFWEKDEALGDARTRPRLLETRSVALPQCTRQAAAQAIAGRLSEHPELGSATVRVAGLVYLPAVAVRLESKKGSRLVVSCLGGRLPLDEGVWRQREAMRTLLARFG
jgi:hypothetical protein